MCAKRFLFRFFDQSSNLKYQQSRRRQSFLHAPSAVPSRNLAKSVVAVAVVLGSKTAEVLVAQTSITRGSRASRPAQHGRGPNQPSVNRPTPLKKTWTLQMALSQRIPKRLRPRQSTRQYPCQTQGYCSTVHLTHRSARP